MEHLEMRVSHPLVSVVTPFHNTARYLARCIESVLEQTYPQFEYILVDNCSTDGSGEIAESYACKDSRIRFIRRSELLSQVQNYNAALAEISIASQYCKIVQADDFIFPDCLRLMVQTFESSESIGLVSAYDLKRNVVRGSGFPYGTSPIPGKDMARLYLRTGLFVFGSPTTVMYRSALVRSQKPFYDESLLHEDSEKCMQILQEWDFGFTHQVLSFLSVDSESISAATRDLEPDSLDRYIMVVRYAPLFLEEQEAAAITKQVRRAYYGVLAQQAIRLQGSRFWQYHEHGLHTIGQTLNRSELILSIGWECLRMMANPGSTIRSAIRFAKGRIGRRTANADLSPRSKEDRSHLAQT
jgi:glycosyltransferase involved in cell wall biosynthesis